MIKEINYICYKTNQESVWQNWVKTSETVVRGGSRNDTVTPMVKLKTCDSTLQHIFTWPVEWYGSLFNFPRAKIQHNNSRVV
jgi:hypothetical protein